MARKKPYSFKTVTMSGIGMVLIFIMLQFFHSHYSEGFKQFLILVFFVFGVVFAISLLVELNILEAFKLGAYNGKK